MCHPNFTHYTEQTKMERRLAGHFICDNNQVKIPYSVDVTWIRQKLITLGLVVRTDARYAISNRLFELFTEMDLEYLLGIHTRVEHHPVGYHWSYRLHYGFCFSEDELMHKLEPAPFVSKLYSVIDTYLEEKLIIHRLKG